VADGSARERHQAARKSATYNTSTKGDRIMKTNKTQEQNRSTESKIKLNKLVLNRETVKELTRSESKNVWGGGRSLMTRYDC
jgi:hypothetical protein